MSYELSFKHEPGYLYVQATGISNVENQIAMASDYLAECDKYGYSMLLLDVRELTGGSDMSTVEAYDLIKKDLRALDIPSLLKVSVVDLEELSEGSRFVEKLAYITGLNLRIFTDIDEAVKWLGVSNSTISERESK
ncbi:hypothetical protein ACFLU3_04670 [Chloroflexota bacterium]